MLHPSPLPKYRGGSPIQNQIINDEKISTVTLFIMDEGIDTGNIIAKKEFSLNGDISQIFNRISNVGFELTRQILKEDYTVTFQDHEKATVYTRRKPEESEITINEIQNKSAIYLHNKIRMLQDPYPNAYIKTIDGKKLFLMSSKIDK